MTQTMTAPAAPDIAKRFHRPLIMGVVNCTPDSFHADSRATTGALAVERALRLAEEGADILDFGGESTRPGSQSVSVEEERARVIPVVREVAKRLKIAISIDTSKAAIAAEGLDAGASILNDVSALQADKDMLDVAPRAEKVVLMHMQGTPKTMQNDPRYQNVFSQISLFLQERRDAFLAAGGREAQVIVDPGIGFGKSLDDNLTMIRRAGELSSIAPVLLGVSRKSMFGKILPDAGPEDRLAGSLSIAAWACYTNVSILRVHDVLETRRVIETLRRVSESA